MAAFKVNVPLLLATGIHARILSKFIDIWESMWKNAIKGEHA
jgi:hypothetical protein